MTQIVYAVIDNHRKKIGTDYKFLHKTKNVHDHIKYLIEKGLIEAW